MTTKDLGAAWLEVPIDLAYYDRTPGPLNTDEWAWTEATRLLVESAATLGCQLLHVYRHRETRPEKAQIVYRVASRVVPRPPDRIER